jgi:hypothetical protein
MTRAHYARKATDDQGNVVPGTTVTVYQPGTLAVLDEDLFVNEVGSVTHDNPFVINDGIIDFYLANARQVKIGLRSPNGTERFSDNQDVYPDPQTVVQAPAGLQITNAPLPGQFLQATGPRQATWVTQETLVTSALSPQEVLLDKNFSLQAISPLTLRLADGSPGTPTFVNVSADTKPEGFTFTHALDWNPTQPVTLSLPSLLFTEPGTLLFVYKTLAPATGQAPAILRATMDDGALWSQTAVDLDTYGVWRVGYLPNIPIGSHILHLRHIPGSDPAARVLLGFVIASYGGSVPFHTHESGGLLSTALGTDAAANFSGATALGGRAVAGGEQATAIGAQASAYQSGTAIGSEATAYDRSVSIGRQARTSPVATDAVALGYNANAQAENSIAIGPHAIAALASGVAVGSGAHAVQDAVALGRDAVALGTSSLALGADATSGHTRSVALGAGAVTTADDQVVLGTSEHTTVIPGTLKHSGDAVLGDVDSTIGFFGETGTTKPVVSGSRGGIAALGDLIAHLADLGLIDDQTTA